MNVWAVTVGEPLPTDGSNVRLYRTGLLTRQLAERGHQVIWWSSVFDHATKAHRPAHEAETAVSPGLTLKWIPSPGYQRNVSLRRIVDHHQAGAAFARMAERQTPPDVILCSLPTLDLAVATTRYGAAHRVPVVIDVRDWWPDEFATALHPMVRPLAQVALAPFRRMARTACRTATAITGITETFVDWGIRAAGRGRRPLDRAFPMGYSARLPEAAELEQGKRFWADHGVTPNADVFTVCYIGNVSPKVELPLVLAAARDVSQGGVPVRMLLCGSGDSYDAVKRAAAGMDHVVMPGRVGRSELWAAMQLSDVGIAPYLPTDSFAATLSNKMIEYWAGALPIVTSLSHGAVVDLIAKYQCGATYRYGNQASLASVLRRLALDRSGVQAMKAKALALFNDRFVAEKVYGEMIDYLQEVAASPAENS